MDNNDKIFEHFKNVSNKQENKDFPAMDKVWTRVSDKLDKKVLKKENKLWKKIAVAASFLLIFTLGYQLFKTEPPITAPKNEVVVSDTVRTISPQPIRQENTVVISNETNPVIRKDAAKILNQQINSTPVAMDAPVPAKISETVSVPEADNVAMEKEDVSAKRSENFERRQAFEAVSVQRNNQQSRGFDLSKPEAKQIIQKSEPLLVIDGKAVTTKNSSDKSVKEGLSGLDADDLEEIVVLKEPLYVINGNYYSEMELFGPNPTSPYAPLSSQEIESLTVLQGEKATRVYGSKGLKGVVIIITKNGKPVQAAKSTGK